MLDGKKRSNSIIIINMLNIIVVYFMVIKMNNPMIKNETRNYSQLDVNILVIIYHKELLLYQMGEWWMRELWIERERER